MMKRLIILFATVALGLAVIASSANAAGGSGPGDALSPVGVSQTVTAHSAQWYAFDYSGKKSLITATVDANGASGIRLAIYTPDEVDLWQRGDALIAIGSGSPLDGHDLGWVGQFTFAGRFYAVVYNDADANTAITVRVTGDAVTTSVEVTPTPTALPNPFAVTTPLGKAITGKLAFVDSAGGILYTMKGDGSNLQRVSFGMDPQWNHSGSQIALAREGPVPGVFTVNADGSNERLLFRTNQVRAPDWSPDDARIVFSYLSQIKGGGEMCFRSHCFEQPQDAQWKLGGVNLADNSFAEVRSTNHAFTPTWNKDGVTIAFNDLSIGLMQTSINGDVEPFPFIGDLRVTAATFNPLKQMSPQYSPDGKSMVYMVLQSPSWEIALANADGSNQHLLTRIDPLDLFAKNNVSPVWSPDSKQILFLSDRNGKWEFFVMNADGSDSHQVLKNVSDAIAIGYEFESERMMSWTR